jgi:AcrR family transcriptional regulator
VSSQPPARERVTRARVLAEALRLVDERGIEGLSMRRLGEACGVEAMSLYHHVPDKAAVLDGISEAVYADIRLPETPDAMSWPEALGEGARALRAALLRHPGAVPVLATRPASHAEYWRLAEWLSRAMGPLGLRPLTTVYVVNAVSLYVVGTTIGQVGISPVRATQLTEELLAARLASVPAQDYPHATGLMSSVDASAFDWDELFETGLAALLDGLRRHVERLTGCGGQPNTSV